MIKENNYWSGKINRLVIEKPFGKDTEDCRAMMDSIAQDWKEDEIYRIDHYLGKSGTDARTRASAHSTRL